MPGHMARVGRYREDGQEHPGGAQNPVAPCRRGGRMNPEDCNTGIGADFAATLRCIR